MAREPGPIQLEAGPVPSHNGLRLNENQCLPPPEPEAPQYHPEKSVGNSKPRMRTPTFQDSKLLPESQILQEEIAARTKEHDHWNKQQLHQAKHARSCTRRQSALDTGLIVMIQQQIAILANDTIARSEDVCPKTQRRRRRTSTLGQKVRARIGSPPYVFTESSNCEYAPHQAPCRARVIRRSRVVAQRDVTSA